MFSPGSLCCSRPIRRQYTWRVPGPSKYTCGHALGVALSDKDIFPDQERFDPGRFLNTKIPRFAFEPFGFAGSRRCPAYHFVYLKISIIVATILPRFRFRLVDETPVKGKLGFVTKPERDIFVNVEHRK